MSWSSKVKHFFFETPEERDTHVVYEEQERESVPMNDDIQLPKVPQKTNVVSIEKAKQVAKVVLLEPRTYAEAQTIADHLKGRRAVVINLQRMPSEQARQIVDFLSGTVYALGGDIQKLGVKTFLCAPDNMDITGAISELMGENEETNNKRW